MNSMRMSHTKAPVPFLIYQPDAVTRYDEESVKAGFYGLLHGKQFIERLLQK